MSEPDVLPLPVLLSRVLGECAVELERAVGVGPDVPSLAVWSNVLRCVADAGDDGLDERALPEAARISSRLATAAVTGAARRGWLTAGPSRGGGKSRHLTLSDIGRAAADAWPAQLASLDAERAPASTAFEAERHGIRDALPRKSPGLRSALEDLVGRLDFELPHFPASYGAADPSAVGGPFVQGGGKGGLPAHGKDWKPVQRVGGDTVSALPLTALLSQALVAFTIDYEDRFPWPLASTLLVLRHIDVEPKPLADVPGDHGITGNGKSLLERHLIAAVTPDPDHRGAKLVALTGRGVTVLHHHPTRLAAVESIWRERFGDTTVATLRESLAPIADASAQPDYVVAPLHNG